MLRELYGVEVGDGCSVVDIGHKDMHSSATGLSG
jgi:hypothetical protein